MKINTITAITLNVQKNFEQLTDKSLYDFCKSNSSIVLLIHDASKSGKRYKEALVILRDLGINTRPLRWTLPFAGWGHLIREQFKFLIDRYPNCHYIGRMDNDGMKTQIDIESILEASWISDKTKELVRMERREEAKFLSAWVNGERATSLLEDCYTYVDENKLQVSGVVSMASSRTNLTTFPSGLVILKQDPVLPISIWPYIQDPLVYYQFETKVIPMNAALANIKYQCVPFIYSTAKSLSQTRNRRRQLKAFESLDANYKLHPNLAGLNWRKPKNLSKRKKRINWGNTNG